MAFPAGPAGYNWAWQAPVPYPVSPVECSWEPMELRAPAHPPALAAECRQGLKAWLGLKAQKVFHAVWVPCKSAKKAWWERSGFRASSEACSWVTAACNWALTAWPAQRRGPTEQPVRREPLDSNPGAVAYKYYPTACRDLPCWDVFFPQ